MCLCAKIASLDNWENIFFVPFTRCFFTEAIWRNGVIKGLTVIMVISLLLSVITTISLRCFLQTSVLVIGVIFYCFSFPQLFFNAIAYLLVALLASLVHFVWLYICNQNFTPGIVQKLTNLINQQQLATVSIATLTFV